MTAAALVNVFVPMPADPNESATAAKHQANALVVATDADYAGAGAILIEIKRRRNELDAKRKELVKPVDEARERIQALFRGPLQELDACEAIVKGKLVGYQNAQEALRAEEQRKADEAARRERERIQEQAREAERKAKEKADADRKAAEAAAAAGRAEEAAKLAARADSTEAKAAEKAEQLEQRAAMVVPPIIQREAPKVAGVATREVWLFEVTDESQVPLEYRPVDLSMIGKVVRALKGSTRIPGVRVYPDKTIAAGGK